MINSISLQLPWQDNPRIQFPMKISISEMASFICARASNSAVSGFIADAEPETKKRTVFSQGQTCAPETFGDMTI